MEAVRFFRLLQRRWMLLLGLTLLGLSLGVLAAVLASDDDTETEAPIYYAANVLLLHRIDAQPGLPRSALLVVAGEVPTRAATALNRDRFDTLARVATIEDHDVATLTVTGVGASPEEASEIATTFADELVAFILERDFEAHDARVEDAEEAIAGHLAVIEALNSQIDSLSSTTGAAEDGAEPVPETADTRAQRELLVAERSARQASYEAALERLDVLQATLPRPAFTTLEISQPFTISEQAYLGRLRAGRTGQANFRAPEGGLAEGGGGFTASLADNPVALVIGGAVAGLLFGVMLVQLLARLDYRILWKEDVEEYYGLPVIAEVPRLRRAERRSSTVLSHSEPISPVAEAYRSLRSSLVYSREVGDHAAPAREAGRRPEVVMITSAVAREGKTSTTANLAAILAEAGYSVLAINCDFRRPQLVHYLGGDAEPCKVSQTDIPGVMMINQVTPEGSEAIPSDALTAQRRIIERARGRFDVILLDTAPLLATNDANDLLAVTDLVLVVAHVGRARKEDGQAAAEVLARRNAPVVGVVLVGVREKPTARSYYYYSNELPRATTSRRRRASRRDKREAPEREEVPASVGAGPVPEPSAAERHADVFSVAPAVSAPEAAGGHSDPEAPAPDAWSAAAGGGHVEVDAVFPNVADIEALGADPELDAVASDVAEPADDHPELDAVATDVAEPADDHPELDAVVSDVAEPADDHPDFDAVASDVSDVAEPADDHPDFDAVASDVAELAEPADDHPELDAVASDVAEPADDHPELEAVDVIGPGEVDDGRLLVAAPPGGNGTDRATRVSVLVDELPPPPQIDPTAPVARVDGAGGADPELVADRAPTRPRPVSRRRRLRTVAASHKVAAGQPSMAGGESAARGEGSGREDASG